jgi:hypothetical protein
VKDRNIYNQAVLEVVENKENALLNVDDIQRVALLAEKYYRQGYEDATNLINLVGPICISDKE